MNTDILRELCDTVEDELEKCNSKIRKSNGELSAGDIEYLDKLTHTMKSLKTTIAMMEAEDGYSNGYMPRTGTYYDVRNGMSYNDGRGNSYARKRDNMGRYSRGYSYADGMDSIVEDMRGMIHDMPEDKRRKVQRMIDELESM